MAKPLPLDLPGTEGDFCLVGMTPTNQAEAVLWARAAARGDFDRDDERDESEARRFTQPNLFEV